MKQQNYIRNIFFCLCLIKGLTASAYDAHINGIYYNLSGNEASVTYRDNNYNSYSGNIVIPASFKYNDITYQVTGIGGSAFRGCTDMTSVTIPNGVKSIGSAAFYDCVGLTSITIPESVSSITHTYNATFGTASGTCSFKGCSNLVTVTINSNAITSRRFIGHAISSFIYDIDNLSDFFGLQVKHYIFGGSVSEIASNACVGLGKLESVTLSEGVKSIGDHTFAACVSLTSIALPSSVTSIGEAAFSDCGKLVSITIPEGITAVKDYTFWYCESLKSIVIPNSVETIGTESFMSCSSLTSVTFGNSVTSIGSSAFSQCGGLTSVTIPNSVISISSSAFSNCNGLTSVTIPNSVTTIGNYAFYGCI